MKFSLGHLLYRSTHNFSAWSLLFNLHFYKNMVCVNKAIRGCRCPRDPELESMVRRRVQRSESVWWKDCRCIECDFQNGRASERRSGRGSQLTEPRNDKRMHCYRLPPDLSSVSARRWSSTICLTLGHLCSQTRRATSHDGSNGREWYILPRRVALAYRIWSNLIYLTGLGSWTDCTATPFSRSNNCNLLWVLCNKLRGNCFSPPHIRLSRCLKTLLESLPPIILNLLFSRACESFTPGSSHRAQSINQFPEARNSNLTSEPYADMLRCCVKIWN